MIVVWILVGMLAALCNVLGTLGIESEAKTLEDFTAEKGYVPKGESGWTEIVVRNVVSVKLAEFTKTSTGDCVRVVHFSVEQGLLDVVEVACDDSPLHTGLLLQEGIYLTYYTMLFIKINLRNVIGTGLYSYKSYRIIDESTCNHVSITQSATISTGNTALIRDTVIVKAENELHCLKLIEGNMFPMSLLSHNVELKSIDTSKFDPIISYNYGKSLGARIYQFENGLVCYRQLRFYTFDIDLGLALRMTCGPAQEVIMRADDFHSRDVVIIYDYNKDIFFLVLHLYKILEPPKGNDKPQICKLTPFNLMEVQGRYKTELVSSSDCDLLMNHDLETAWNRGLGIDKYYMDMMATNVHHIIPDLTAKPKKGWSVSLNWKLLKKPRKQLVKIEKGDILSKLEGYYMVRRNDYDLAHEMGIVMIKFKNGASYKKGIFVVARGILLTGYLSKDTTDGVALDISDSLFCNDVLLARKSGYNTFKVVVKTSNTECTKQIFKFTDLLTMSTIEEVSTLSKSDPDCNSLLARKLDKIQQSENPSNGEKNE